MRPHSTWQPPAQRTHRCTIVITSRTPLHLPSLPTAQTHITHLCQQCSSSLTRPHSGSCLPLMQGISTTSAPADSTATSGTTGTTTTSGAEVVPPTEATLAAATTATTIATATMPAEGLLATGGTPSSTASEASAGSSYQKAVEGAQAEAPISQVGWLANRVGAAAL